MKKCNFCGTENLESALFCELCGRRFELETEELSNNPIIVHEEGTENTDFPVELVHNNRETSESEADDLSAYVDDNNLQNEAFYGKSSSNSKAKTISLFAIAAIVILAVGLWFGPGDGLGAIIGDDLPDVPPVDMYETNDSMSTATIAQVGNTYKGVLSSAEDKDYFCIPTNGHTSLSYTFTRNSSRTIDGIGWEISYHHGDGTASRMAWLNEKKLTDECDGIGVTDGYFIVWIENTRNDPNMEEVMEFVSCTEYSITFSYAD